LGPAFDTRTIVSGAAAGAVGDATISVDDALVVVFNAGLVDPDAATSSATVHPGGDVPAAAPMQAGAGVPAKEMK
jgi:hypothetical protein